VHELTDLANRATEYKRELEQAIQHRDHLTAQHQLELDALRQQINQLQAELVHKDAQMQENLTRITEIAEIEKERAILAVQRESMDEIGRLREALALAREERAALEVELTKLQNRPPQQTQRKSH
jgi:DNA-binding transcriptional regulator YiaG